MGKYGSQQRRGLGVAMWRRGSVLGIVVIAGLFALPWAAAAGGGGNDKGSGGGGRPSTTTTSSSVPSSTTTTTSSTTTTAWTTTTTVGGGRADVGVEVDAPAVQAYLVRHAIGQADPVPVCSVADCPEWYLEHRLTVTNHGTSTARSVVLADRVDLDGAAAQVSLSVSGPFDCTALSQPATITCPLGDLGPGQSVTVSVQVHLTSDATTYRDLWGDRYYVSGPAAGRVTSVASVTTPGDTDVANDTASGSTVMQSGPRFRLGDVIAG